MGTRLLNVRLDEDRVRKARRLRACGVALSDVVRDAIDARFEALDQPLTGRDAVATVARILGRHPIQLTCGRERMTSMMRPRPAPPSLVRWRANGDDPV